MRFYTYIDILIITHTYSHTCTHAYAHPAILDPLSQVISASAASADLEPSDHAVYHINTITAAQNVLRKYPFARSRLEILTLTLDTYVEQLVNSQCTVLFREVGLADKMTAIARIADLKARGITEYVDSDNNGNNCDSLGNSLSRNSDDDQSFNNQNAAADKKTPKSMRLCDVPELQIDLLAQALSNFYTNLFSVGTFVMPQCDRILNAQVRICLCMYMYTCMC